jgi:hypothetical protein
MSSNSIRFLHIRNLHNENNGDDSYISCKGGTTVAYEVDDDTIRFAVAKCSIRDNYCRKTGRAIATGRLNTGKDQTIVHMTGTPIEAILRNIENVNQNAGS